MLTSRRTTIALALLLTAALASGPAGPASSTGSTTSTVSASSLVPARSGPAKEPVAGCHVFPANNYWHADISGLPRHPRSAQWISHMSPRTDLHPDFGPSYGAQPVPYGIAITVVGRQHHKVPVRFGYASESDHVRYPLGADTRIEGGRSSDGDRHAVIVNKVSCRLFETWLTRKSGGRWYAGSGATWKLDSNRLRPDGWTSADAAGLPILPGLLRYHEVEVRGKVNHAVRFTTDVTSTRHIWPARHDAGSTSSRAYPPMGARFRLKASFSTRGYRHDTRVVLRAMKTYGLVLADNGSPWFFQGTASNRWPSGLLDELKSIPARAFVAVDTRSLRVSRDSAGVRR